VFLLFKTLLSSHRVLSASQQRHGDLGQPKIRTSTTAHALYAKCSWTHHLLYNCDLRRWSRETHLHTTLFLAAPPQFLPAPWQCSEMVSSAYDIPVHVVEGRLALLLYGPKRPRKPTPLPLPPLPLPTPL
jgi:hypothetical protein